MFGVLRKSPYIGPYKEHKFIMLREKQRKCKRWTQKTKHKIEYTWRERKSVEGFAVVDVIVGALSFQTEMKRKYVVSVDGNVWCFKSKIFDFDEYLHFIPFLLLAVFLSIESIVECSYECSTLMTCDTLP